MPAYCFRCPTCKNEEGEPFTFTIFLSTVPKRVKKDADCTQCEGRAARALDLEIPTQNVVGMTPISNAFLPLIEKIDETTLILIKEEINKKR